MRNAGNFPEDHAQSTTQNVGGFARRKEQRLPRDELEPQRIEPELQDRVIIQRWRVRHSYSIPRRSGASPQLPNSLTGSPAHTMYCRNNSISTYLFWMMPLCRTTARLPYLRQKTERNYLSPDSVYISVRRANGSYSRRAAKSAPRFRL